MPDYTFSLDSKTFADQVTFLRKAIDTLEEKGDYAFSEEEWTLLDLGPEKLQFEGNSALLEFTTNLREKLDQKVKSYSYYFRCMEAEDNLSLFDNCRLTEETRKRVTKWVKALRTGGYKQGTGRLQQMLLNPKGEVYCCLGVADYCLNLNSPNKKVLGHVHRDIGLSTAYGHFNIPPDANIVDCPAEILNEIYVPSLVFLNDELGWTFDMIANFVEKQFNIAAKSEFSLRLSTRLRWNNVLWLNR